MKNEQLTFAQFARKVGVSKPYITKMVKQGKIETIEKYGTKMIPCNEKNLKPFNQVEK